MAERLVAWLHGTPVATLTPGPHYRMTLEWRDEGIERWGRGSRALSVGLPLGSPVGPRDMRALDGIDVTKKSNVGKGPFPVNL